MKTSGATKMKPFKAGIRSSCIWRWRSPNLPGIRAGGSDQLWGFVRRRDASWRQSCVFLREGLGGRGGGGGGNTQGPIWAAERPRGPLPGSPGVASLRSLSSPETLPTHSLGIAGETGFSPECTQKGKKMSGIVVSNNPNYRSLLMPFL